MPNSILFNSINPLINGIVSLSHWQAPGIKSINFIVRV
jgi:hypothetical protein